ncbi:hypothetical protein CLAIMM_11075 [Cladophialophora immunda]|nr:hypothetical protein CLAIMM_11075 [Cladophialophora immunda]
MCYLCGTPKYNLAHLGITDPEPPYTINIYVDEVKQLHRRGVNSVNKDQYPKEGFRVYGGSSSRSALAILGAPDTRRKRHAHPMAGCPSARKRPTNLTRRQTDHKLYRIRNRRQAALDIPNDTRKDTVLEEDVSERRVPLFRHDGDLYHVTSRNNGNDFDNDENDSSSDNVDDNGDHEANDKGVSKKTIAMANYEIDDEDESMWQQSLRWPAPPRPTGGLYDGKDHGIANKERVKATYLRSGQDDENEDHRDDDDDDDDEIVHYHTSNLEPSDSRGLTAMTIAFRPQGEIYEFRREYTQRNRRE